MRVAKRSDLRISHKNCSRPTVWSGSSGVLPPARHRLPLLVPPTGPAAKTRSLVRTFTSSVSWSDLTLRCKPIRLELNTNRPKLKSAIHIRYKELTIGDLKDEAQDKPERLTQRAE
jgi:hypothetical protein